MHSVPSNHSSDSVAAAEGTEWKELAVLLPAYEWLSLLGAGGMGQVFLARQTEMNRLVAIKVLSNAAANDPEAVERFNREAQCMSRLSHPHIIALYDFGRTTAGHWYLVMEYVEGRDLHQLRHSGDLPQNRILPLIRQLGEALAYAHDQGLAHRDIKPANILVTTDWQVKITDFGLAADFTLPDDANSSYGTPEYAAPECYQPDAQVDDRADIYAFGVVMHELFTGRTPQAAGFTACQGMPEELIGIVSKCLMRDPDRRYPCIRDVLTALAPTFQAPPLPAAVSTPYRVPMMPSRSPSPPPKTTSNRIWSIGSLILIVGLGALIWYDHRDIAADDFPEPPPESLAISPSTVLQHTTAMNKSIPAALLLTASSAFGVDYASQIAPILRVKCHACHSETKGKVKGDLALEPDAKLVENIGSGKSIIPGEPDKSKLLSLCKLPDDDSDVMPPKGKNRLTPEELTLLETWIQEGASLTGGKPSPTAAPAPTPAPAPSAAAPEIWTSNDGKTVEAVFVGLEGENVKLKVTSNGAVYTFPLSRLSPESQAKAKAAAGQ